MLSSNIMEDPRENLGNKNLWIQSGTFLISSFFLLFSYTNSN